MSKLQYTLLCFAIGHEKKGLLSIEMEKIIYFSPLVGGC